MVTQKDIANFLKVPISTVSVALNNDYKSKRVSRASRDLIKQVAREMGYEVDDMARGIKTGKVSVIGFASSAPTSEHSAKISDSMSVTAEKYSYMIKLINGHFLGHDDGSKYKEVANTCVKNRLSALVLHGLSNREILKRLKAILDEHGIELALISNASDNADCLHVTSCDTSGIAQAVNYLHELGHRKFAFISLALSHSASIIRREAFFSIVKELQIKDPIAFAGSHQQILPFLDEVFAGRNKHYPTAIVCSGDDIATLTQSYLIKKYSIRTPEDVSITGYGDFRGGRECFPELTTVYEPFAEIGTRIIEKLVAKLQNHNFGEFKELVDTKLIVRGSTAVAPGNNFQ